MSAIERSRRARASRSNGRTRTRPQRVPETTLRVLLERIGLPCGNATQIKHSMAARSMPNCRGRKLPPLITAEVDRGIALPVSAAKSGARYRIELESGAVIDGRFTSPKGEHGAALADRGAGLSHARHQRPSHDARGRARRAATRSTTRGARSHEDCDATTRRRSGASRRRCTGCAATGDGGIGDFSALAIARDASREARRPCASRSARCTRCSAPSRTSSARIRRRRGSF